MRIDAHQHFWRYDAARDGWITPDMRALMRDFLPAELGPELAAHGVDGCVAVQADQSEAETRFLLDLAARHPFIKGVVGWVDLRAPNVTERLAHFARDPRFRGCRHVAQSEPDDFLAREEVVRGIGCLRALGLTYDLLVYPRQLPAALALVERLPGQPFVLDHLAKPPVRARALEPWASYVRALAANPHVCCKISGLVTEAHWDRWHPDDFRPYLDVVFDAFGPERVLFGSDWPVCLLAGRYGEVLGLVADYVRGFSGEDQERLFGANAVRVYGLDTVEH